jgi:hypothetical protein
MARYRFQHWTTLTALLLIALASCGLTACGTSSNQASQARSLSPQEAAKRRAGIVELVNCARRHGIHLPPPTEAGVNVSGVKGRRHEEAMSACYQKVLKKSRREERAERASQAGQEASPPALGEEPPPG